MFSCSSLQRNARQSPKPVKLPSTSTKGVASLHNSVGIVVRVEDAIIRPWRKFEKLDLAEARSERRAVSLTRGRNSPYVSLRHEVKFDIVNLNDTISFFDVSGCSAVVVFEWHILPTIHFIPATTVLFNIEIFD